MMENFEIAFEEIVGLEGGYVNNPDDPGGETKYGISKRSYPYEDIKNLTLARAKQIYMEDYWDQVMADWMPYPLDIYLFDAAVNQGVGTAKRLLQEALKVEVDGIIGKKTLTAAAAATEEQIAMFMSLRALKYTRTLNFSIFGKGWFKRLFKIAMKHN